MYFKTIIFLLVSLNLSIIFSNPLTNSNKFPISECYSSSSGDGSYTERLMIDGIWWIIVYNSDGFVVGKFLDPNQN